MEEVVLPVFHEYVVPPDAVSVALCPAQIVVLPLMEATMLQPQVVLVES